MMARRRFFGCSQLELVVLMISNVGLVIPENSRRALGDSPLTVRDPLLPICLMVLAFSTEDDSSRCSCDL